MPYIRCDLVVRAFPCFEFTGGCGSSCPLASSNSHNLLRTHPHGEMGSSHAWAHHHWRGQLSCYALQRLYMSVPLCPSVCLPRMKRSDDDAPTDPEHVAANTLSGSGIRMDPLRPSGRGVHLRTPFFFSPALRRLGGLDIQTNR